MSARAACAVAALMTLAACHGHHAAGVTLDADEDARNATAAKIDADLAAADAAARAPMPRAQPRPVAPQADDAADARDAPTAEPENAEPPADNDAAG